MHRRATAVPVSSPRVEARPERRRALRRIDSEPSGQAVGVAHLGARLKSARERTGFSVRGLARRVNVSPSLVSQIEHGRVTPSVGTLYAMVNELGLGLDDLFRDSGQATENGRAAARPSPVQRRHNRKAIRLADGVRWELLTPTPDQELEFFHVVYDAGAESCGNDSLISHGGMEYAYILRGRLGVRIGGEEYELRAGDSLSFDAQRPHRLWTIGRRPAVAIWAVLNRSGDKRVKRRSWT
jgi:transcriptional regulator with XRE-family HTH domain